MDDYDIYGAVAFIMSALWILVLLYLISPALASSCPMLVVALLVGHYIGGRVASYLRRRRSHS